MILEIQLPYNFFSYKLAQHNSPFQCPPPLNSVNIYPILQEVYDANMLLYTWWFVWGGCYSHVEWWEMMMMMMMMLFLYLPWTIEATKLITKASTMKRGCPIILSEGQGGESMLQDKSNLIYEKLEWFLFFLKKKLILVWHVEQSSWQGLPPINQASLPFYLCSLNKISSPRQLPNPNHTSLAMLTTLWICQWGNR